MKSINTFYFKVKAPATSAEVLSHQEGVGSIIMMVLGGGLYMN